MTSWLNRAVFQLPRNGTTTHTVDPSSATNLVAGSAFTPTAGRLLVAVIEGAVTSSTPAGWTLPAGGSAVNNTGLYVWSRVAVTGSNAFTTTHNASNYPIVVAIYEFPATSTLVTSVSATGLTYNGANPALSGLTGANTVMAAKARGVPDTDAYAYTWAGTGSPVEDWDLLTPVSGTDGYAATVAYVDGFTGTSWQPTATNQVTAGSYEALTWAVNVPSGGSSASGTGSLGFGASMGASVSGAGHASAALAVSAQASAGLTASSSLVISAAGAAVARAAGAGSLELAGAMSSGGTTPASGTGSLSLGAAGGAAGRAAGFAQLSLSASSAARTVGGGAGTLTLTAAAVASTLAAGTATLTLTGVYMTTPIVTPASRTVVVPADARDLTVPADPRTVQVPR